jgi:hypothetical protein
MEKGELELRISLRKLLIALFVTVVPLSLLSLYTITRTEQSLRQTTGSNFHTIANALAIQVSNYVHDRALQVATLARTPGVVEAVEQGNRRRAALSEAALREQIDRIERTWNTPQVDALVRDILSSPASRAFQEQIKLDRRFLRITLTDDRGQVIAASHKTLDYYQADEEFWQAVNAQGRGAVNLTDILYDEVTKSNYIGIGVPVMENATNRFIGVLDVLMDISSIFPAANPPGSTIRRMLIKNDGTIISGPGVTLSMNAKSEEYSLAREALQSAAGRQAGFAQGPLSNNTDALVGFADTRLQEDYKNLNWLVLVAQDGREAFASIRQVVRFIWFMALMSLAAVTFLTVYFSLHRAVRYEGLAEAARTKAAAQ